MYMRFVAAVLLAVFMGIPMSVYLFLKYHGYPTEDRMLAIFIMYALAAIALDLLGSEK